MAKSKDSTCGATQLRSADKKRSHDGKGSVDG